MSTVYLNTICQLSGYGEFSRQIASFKFVDKVLNSMQDGLRDTTQKSSIGDLPAILRVDGVEYQITADSTPNISEESAETIEVEIPCMYCDTKNKIQYSGMIQSPVSCQCSQCDEEIVVSSNSDASSISVSTLVEKISQYQNERVAYIAGQQSTQDLDTIVRNRQLIIYVFSILSGSLIFSIASSLKTVIELEFPPLAADEFMISLVYIIPTSWMMFIFSNFLFFPVIVSWYANIPGNKDCQTVMTFFEGYED